MKLSYVEMCGFRGYSNAVRISFGEQFTIIEGRNGVGKSTVFDAIEYAMTGELSKYNGAKASGESVEDYLWWRGQGTSPSNPYVEVGFQHEDQIVSIRRGPAESCSDLELENLRSLLCDVRTAPKFALKQLCLVSIIRDEKIVELSLDMKETDRYTLLKGALGVYDSEHWIERGKKLVDLAKAKEIESKIEVDKAHESLAQASRRLDEIRSGLSKDEVVDGASKRLQSLLGVRAEYDQLAGLARELLASEKRKIGDIEEVVEIFPSFKDKEQSIKDTERRIHESQEKLAALVAERDLLNSEILDYSGFEIEEFSLTLADIIEKGRSLGLVHGQCPLCSHCQTNEEFLQGVETMHAVAIDVSAKAIKLANLKFRLESNHRSIQSLNTQIEKDQNSLRELRRWFEGILDNFDRYKIDIDASVDVLKALVISIREKIGLLESDLSIMETLQNNRIYEQAVRDELGAKERHILAQRKAGASRAASMRATALYDAARRASSEALDLRLSKVLPLMSELYQRLKPHPSWDNIEYSIRGEVRKFLSLQVGQDLNPQFLFSSGQRRATGLAFLLSINLSLTWSKWKTVLLDDPVQHIDDFRSVHLAELLAQFVSNGKQVICSVEDSALADLLARRLPVDRLGTAKKVTLGSDESGSLAIISDQEIKPLPIRTILQTERYQSSI